MTSRNCILTGAPIDCGKRRQGCLMGPDAYRTAGIANTISELGYEVFDDGNVAPRATTGDLAPSPNEALWARSEIIGWTQALSDAALAASERGLAVFMGGDHAMSLGTVSGVARHAQALNQPQFVLWLDAHTDYHTPLTTDSGHLHGTPLGYVTGREGFDGFPTLSAPVPQENVCLIGLRSVDGAEAEALGESRMIAHDMRAIDENGIAAPLKTFLARVKGANGRLHVSLDVDFLDPTIAPAVGTTVPGGATYREAHLMMEILHDSGLVTSVDLAELNPFLDERGRTAGVMVDLIASLLGRRVFDRPTRAF